MKRNRFGAEGAGAGDQVGRRGFLRSAAGTVAVWTSAPAWTGAVTRVAGPRATSCIFILLAGGPSHTDTFDFKEGAWTPASFCPENYNGVRFPRGLMPGIADRLDCIALLRSFRSWSISHPVAQEWLQIGCDPISEAGCDAPHLGSALAQTDAAQALAILRAEAAGVSFSNACVEACEIVERQNGQFVQITFEGWDHHANIYGPDAGLPRMARQFDIGFSQLLDRLRGKQLLERTLVVAVGEFGRTGGTLNASSGRDHALQNSVLLAGAGIRGPRSVGRTDVTGATILESGWSHDRAIWPEDLWATIQFAMGVHPVSRRDSAAPVNGSPVTELWA